MLEQRRKAAGEGQRESEEAVARGQADGARRVALQGGERALPAQEQVARLRGHLAQLLQELRELLDRVRVRVRVRLG